MPIGDECVWLEGGSFAVVFRMATKTEARKPFTVDKSRKEHILQFHSLSSPGYGSKFLTDDWKEIVRLIDQTVREPVKIERERQRRK